jgi:hypothetical protein
MSIERLLGKSKEDLQGLSDQEMLELFKQRALERNQSYELPAKMSLVPPTIIGLSLGYLGFTLFKARRVS